MVPWYRTFICTVFVAINGPEVGEADSLLAKALDRKFSGRLGWHISVKQNLFRTSGPTVENILNEREERAFIYKIYYGRTGI